MTYGRVRNVADWDPFESAAISHLAELVRGNLSCGQERPPHPPLRGTFSPRGEGPARPLAEVHHCPSLSSRAGMCTKSAL
jgi:hypothetical protein